MKKVRLWFKIEEVPVLKHDMRIARIHAMRSKWNTPVLCYHKCSQYELEHFCKFNSTGVLTLWTIQNFNLTSKITLYNCCNNFSALIKLTKTRRHYKKQRMINEEYPIIGHWSILELNFSSSHLCRFWNLNYKIIFYNLDITIVMENTHRNGGWYRVRFPLFQIIVPHCQRFPTPYTAIAGNGKLMSYAIQRLMMVISERQ